MTIVGSAPSSGMELANFRRLIQQKVTTMPTSDVSATLDELCKIVEDVHRKDPTSRLARHMADAVAHALFKDHPDNDHWLRIFAIVAKFSTNLGASGVYDLVNYNGGLHRSEPFHVVWAQSHADAKNLARFQLVVDVALTRFPNSQSLHQSLNEIARNTFADERIIGLGDHDMTAQIFQLQPGADESPTAEECPHPSVNNNLDGVGKMPSLVKDNSSTELSLCRRRSSMFQPALSVVCEEALEHSNETTMVNAPQMVPIAPLPDDQSFSVYLDEDAERTREEAELETQVKYASAAAATMDARAIISPKSPGGVIVETCKKPPCQTPTGGTPSCNNFEAENSPFCTIAEVTPPTPLDLMSIDCGGGEVNTPPPDEVMVLTPHQDPLPLPRRLVGVIDFAVLDEVTAEIGRPPIVHSSPFAMGYVPQRPSLNVVSPAIEVPKPVIFAESALQTLPAARSRKSSTLGGHLMRNHLPLGEKNDKVNVAAPARQAKKSTHYDIQMKLGDLLLLENNETQKNDETQKNIPKTAATVDNNSSKQRRDSSFLFEDHDDHNRLPAARRDSTFLLEEYDSVATKRTTSNQHAFRVTDSPDKWTTDTIYAGKQRQRRH